MIARPASSPHICLGCQRRLARWSTPYPFQLAHQSTTAGASPSAESTSNSKRPIDRSRPVRQTLVSLAQYQNKNADYQPAFKRYRVVQQASNGFYGHRGQKMIKDQETLKVDKFGKATDVIVLRESIITRYDGGGRSVDDKLAEHIDIMGRLNKERGLISQSEIEQNINEFRPKEDKEPKNRTEFNSLVHVMQDAFTTPQLERYINSFEGKRNLDLSPKSPLTPLPSLTKSDSDRMGGGISIMKETPWIPETADPSGYLEEKISLRGYALASHTTKQRLVVQLLRECWMLELPDVVVSLGHVDLIIREGDVELLSNSGILEVIKEKLLREDNEDIEVFLARNLIRVTTTEAKCKHVLRWIKGALKSIKRDTISVTDMMPPSKDGRKHSFRQIKRWADLHFDDAALLELSKLTDVHIKRLSNVPLHKSQMPLSLSCLENSKVPWKSNRIDMARRLLLSSASLPYRTHRILGCRDTPGWESGIFAPSNPQDLSWRQQLRQWTRWTVPIEKVNQVSTNSTVPRGFVSPSDKDVGISSSAYADFNTGSSISTPANVIETSKNTANTAGTIPVNDPWSGKSIQHSSAIFGSILHSHPNAGKETDITSPWGINGTLRDFSSALPNMSNVFSNARLDDSKRNTQTLTIRLRPNPFQINAATKRSLGGAVLSAFPIIEMHLDVHSNRPLELNTVEAVMQETHSDLMMPSQAVDVRFHQRQSRLLNGHSLDLPAIQKFLRSITSGTESRRLDLPPTVTLPVSSLCDSSVFNRLGLSAEDRTLEYIFSEREIRNTMHLTWNDWRLVYTHVNSGKTARKRSELALKAQKIQSRGTSQEFLDTALEIAESFGLSSIPIVRRDLMNDDLTRTIPISVSKQGPKPRVFTMEAKRPVDVGGKAEWGFLNDLEDVVESETGEDVAESISSNPSEGARSATREERSDSRLSNEAGLSRKD